MKQALLFLFTFFSLQIYTQNQFDNWHLMDFKTDEMPGIGIEKAYTDLLSDQPARETIIVAVIDSGIDIDHEDLKTVIWINEDEIAGNNIDDDKNGYIDDVNGWNFLGNANGHMVNFDNLEVARLYKEYKAYFEQKSADVIKKHDLDKWRKYQKIKNELEENRKAALEQKAQYEEISLAYFGSLEIISAYLEKEDIKPSNLSEIGNDAEEDVLLARDFLASLWKQGVGETDLAEWGDYVLERADWYYNPDVDVRKDIIKDDTDNLYEVGYGNNKVGGVSPDHGTHVAGIIAAIRGNNVGMDGIADKVKVMPIRAVPDGDEHDKDVSNAIRYAVDNGARVINMSFGKSYSPHENIVSEAIQYAEDNGVLLVHAAGNDGNNLDEEDNYPTNYSPYIKGKVKTYLTVGATSNNTDKHIIAEFSNYGAEKVDIFAPGDDIFSTTPNNTYQHFGGTSMAAPMVSGVAALIMSRYPDLSAKKVKKIIEKSTTPLNEKDVYLPGSLDENTGTSKTVDFGKLAKTAGLLNAYEALKLAKSKSKYGKPKRISN